MQLNRKPSANRLKHLLVILLFSLILLLFSTGVSYGDDTFTLDNTTEDSQFLNFIDTGWETLIGLALRSTDQELILFTPKPDAGRIQFEEKDWPPRIIFVLPFDPAYPNRRTIEETYILDQLPLFDRISIKPVEFGSEVTLLLHHPLRFSFQEYPTTYELRVRITGVFREIIDEGSGWRLWEITRYLQEGIQHCYIAQIDPAQPGMMVKVADTSTVGYTNNTLEKYVEANDAIGGINGGFFSNTKPLGLVIRDGRITSLPMLNRPAILGSPDGEFHIGQPQVSCRIRIGESGYLLVDTINSYPEYGPLLLSPLHPARIRTPFDGRKVIIEGNFIKSITDGEIEEFGDRLIIWDHDGKAPILDYAKTGDQIELEFSVTNMPFLPQWGVQAGPLLAVEGEVIKDFTNSSFLPDITSGRSPRTAVALTDQDEILLFHGEGRMSVHSLGFTLTEAAELLVGLGAESVLNLDGGGSSSIFVNGKYYGGVSRAGRKSIPNCIVFGNF